VTNVVAVEKVVGMGMQVERSGVGSERSPLEAAAAVRRSVEFGAGDYGIEILGLRRRSAVGMNAVRWERLPLWAKVQVVHFARCWLEILNQQHSWSQPEN
jgi:hypothetical protein